MKVNLDSDNFYYFAFHPDSSLLSPEDQKTTLVATIFLGILTSGIGHLICGIIYGIKTAQASLPSSPTGEFAKGKIGNPLFGGKTNNPSTLTEQPESTPATETSSNITPPPSNEKSKKSEKAKLENPVLPKRTNEPEPQTKHSAAASTLDHKTATITTKTTFTTITPSASTMPSISPETWHERHLELDKELRGVFVKFYQCDKYKGTMASCLIAFNEQQHLCRKIQTGQAGIQDIINNTFKKYTTALIELGIDLPKISEQIYNLNSKYADLFAADNASIFGTPHLLINYVAKDAEDFAQLIEKHRNDWESKKELFFQFREKFKTLPWQLCTLSNEELFPAETTENASAIKVLSQLRK